jgi:hypothetical protein
MQHGIHTYSGSDTPAYPRVNGDPFNGCQAGKTVPPHPHTSSWHSDPLLRTGHLYLSRKYIKRLVVVVNLYCYNNDYYDY